LDLFSGDRSRTCHALQCLLREPQNNLGFFVDGIAAGLDEVHRLVASISGLSGTEASVFLAELIATILIDSGDYYALNARSLAVHEGASNGVLASYQKCGMASALSRK